MEIPLPQNISKLHILPNPSISMAALSAGHHHFFGGAAATQFRNRIRKPRSMSVLCRHSQDPSEEEAKKNEEKKQRISGFMERIEKMGIELKEKLRPQKKGDWKDLTLMSLSFAVYVYISQKIVCAYCLWMSMPKQVW